MRSPTDVSTASFVMYSSRAITSAAIFVLAVLLAACSSDEAGSANGSPSQPVDSSASEDIPQPEFDTDEFAALNPAPEIRNFDPEIDLDFYENNRLPRDAIEPVYSPVFVPPDQSHLREDEVVMGLEINGDARAYPVGMLRVREMVNDEVGGTPVLVSW